MKKKPPLQRANILPWSVNQLNSILTDPIKPPKYIPAWLSASTNHTFAVYDGVLLVCDGELHNRTIKRHFFPTKADKIYPYYIWFDLEAGKTKVLWDARQYCEHPKTLRIFKSVCALMAEKLHSYSPGQPQLTITIDIYGQTEEIIPIDPVCVCSVLNPADALYLYKRAIK